MTRAGAVGDQIPMAMPSKVVTNSSRAAGAQMDAAVALGDTEAEFVDLLAKLQRGEKPPSEDANPELSEERPFQAERRGATRSPVSDEQLAEQENGAKERKAECTTCGDDVVEVIDVVDVEEIEQIDSPASAATDALANTPSRVEGIVIEKAAAASTPTSAVPAAEKPQQAQPEIRKPPLPAAAANTPAADKSVSVDARSLPPPVETAPPARAKDVMPSVVVEPPVGNVPASDPAPAAKVLRQEAHFAPSKPVSQFTATATATAVPSAAKTDGAASGLDAKGNEAAASQHARAEPLVGEQPLPATPPKPVQQIVDRIAVEVSVADQANPASQVRAESVQSNSSSVVKVIQIQLQPAELGTVTVRIELQQADLELHVEVNSAETADIIRNDKDSLTNLLRGAGYSVDSASIRVVEVDRSGATSAQLGQQGGQANLQSSGQSQPGWSRGGERSPQENPGTNQNSGSQAGNRNDAHGTTSHRASGGVYI